MRNGVCGDGAHLVRMPVKQNSADVVTCPRCAVQFDNFEDYFAHVSNTHGNSVGGWHTVSNPIVAYFLDGQTAAQFGVNPHVLDC